MPKEEVSWTRIRHPEKQKSRRPVSGHEAPTTGVPGPEMGLWEEESRASRGERSEDKSHTGAQSLNWEQNVRSRMQKPDPVPAASWGQEIHPGGSRSRLRTGCLGLFHIWGRAGTAGGGQALGWKSAGLRGREKSASDFQFYTPSCAFPKSTSIAG